MTGETLSSTHPLLPPTSEDDRIDRLRLLRSRRVGIATYYRLMAEHGSASDALAALPEIARAAGLSDYRVCPSGVAEAELHAGSRCDARAIFFGESDYPRRLMDLEDAPPMLWMRGDIDLAGTESVALVGARNASSLGTRMARALSKDLAGEGFTIVSGMARGVDTVAHLTALDTGTIAVFAGGVDIFYPAENTRLGQDIAAKGLIVSEQPPGLAPVAHHFPARNRLISGLSRAMVVVEAAVKSGSMSAARHALDQGRDVLAVPGHPLEPRAAGCNLLIRDGARLVRSAQDVIEAIQPLDGAASASDQPTLPLSVQDDPVGRTLRETARLHGEILARLAPAPMAEDHLIRSLDAPASLVTEQLTDLELDGHIERQIGGTIRRLN